MVLHGTPGSSRQLAGLDRPARDHGWLAKPDADLLRDDAGLRDAFLDDLRHPSRTAGRAAARDFWLFARRWDVDLAGMAAHVWHGT